MTCHFHRVTNGPHVIDDYKKKSPHQGRIIKAKFIFLLSLPFFLSFTIAEPAHAILALTGKLNINSATTKELTLLPNIGKVKAEAIFSYKRQEGKFKRAESLIEVKGIGVKTLSHIRPYIKLAGESDLSIIDTDETSDHTVTSNVFPDTKISLLANEGLFTALLKAIKEAKDEVVVSMFLFKTSEYPSNRANIIMETLVSAAKRGVRVVLLLEEGKSVGGSVTQANKISANRLIAGGAIVRFDGPRRTTHTKVVVVDREKVFLGSHNFTHSALKYNNELSVNVNSKAFAEEVLAYINGLMD